MNAAQHARACAVIERTVFLCGGYLVTEAPAYTQHNPERGFVCCAMGELALDAGHTVEDLEAMDEAVEQYTVEMPRLVTAFGLDEEGCERIVRANEEPIDVLGPDAAAEFVIDIDDEDNLVYSMPKARKAAVLSVLDDLAQVPVVPVVPA